MTLLRSLAPLLLGLSTALAAGCVVSPQPSPPDVIFDGARLGLTPSIEALSSVVGFQAQPGTVTPAGGEVRITNLDTTDAPSIAKVEADGSFTIAVPGLPGQTFRFQAKNGDARSAPFDARVDLSGGDLSSGLTPPSCVAFDPPRWVALDGAGDARSIVLENGCASAISIAPPRLRRGLGGFSFSPTGPIEIGPAATATLTFRAGDGPEVEDVVLLDVTAPSPVRHAVTLTVPDR
ncbi:MAG: hypothetical protein U0359_19920 [Byssovorax sp.]